MIDPLQSADPVGFLLNIEKGRPMALNLPSKSIDCKFSMVIDGVTPMFHKTSRASLIFLRRAGLFRRLRISPNTSLPELFALRKHLRRNHFPIL